MKKVIAGAAAAAALLSVAACGNSTDSSSTSSDGKLSGTITFQTWNLKNDKYTPYFNSLIKAYEKKNPGTTIKWVDQPSDGYEDKLAADAASGGLPDVIDAGPSLMYALVKAGALLNISKEDSSAKSLYNEGAWDAVTFKGEKITTGAYGYPWYVNDGPMYYNTKVMKQCGLNPDNLPTNWDEYFSQAETVAKNCGSKGIYMSTTMGSNVEDYVSAGAKWMNDAHTKYTLNDDVAVSQLEKFAKLYQNKGIPPEALSAQWSNQSDYFQRGSLIAMAGSAYSAADFKQNSPDLYKNLTVGPKITNEDKASTVSYEMLAVSSQTKNKALAMDFTKFVTNSENQLAFDKKSSTFPSSKGTLDDKYFTEATSGTDLQSRAMKITLAAVKTGYSSRPVEFSDNGGYTYMRDQAGLALQGKQTAKQALDKVEAFSNKKLAE
jgi:multiple sugar transport system substrate-binding protein